MLDPKHLFPIQSKAGFLRAIATNPPCREIRERQSQRIKESLEKPLPPH